MATMTTSWKNYAKKTWTGSSGTKITFYLDAKYTKQSVENNSSSGVYTRLRSTVDVGSASGSGYTFTCTYCDKVSGTGVWNFEDETIMTSPSKTITHSTDGSKSLSLSATAKNTYLGIDISLSATVDLPKIDRLATVTSTSDFTDEENPTLSFSNPASFTVKPWLVIKDDAGTSVYSLSRTTGVTSPYTWSLTDAERTSMRTATNKQKKYKVQVGIDTYNGSTKLGNNYKEQTMTYVNAEPSQSTTFMETNSKVVSVLGTSNANTIIQNVSQLKLTSTPTVKKGATVSKITFEHNDLSTDDPTSPYEQTYVPVNSKFKVIITDSRGYSIPTEYTKSIVAYVPIDISSHSFKRQSPTSSNIVLNAEIRYKQATFESKTNTPTIQWKLGSDGTLKTLSSSDYTIDTTNNKIKISNLVLENVLDYKNPGEFYLYASDLLTSDTENAYPVPKGIPTFDAGEHDFKVNGELYIADENGQSKKEIRDLFFPVGSTYITSENVSPASYLGGTWDLVDKEFKQVKFTELSTVVTLNTTNCSSVTRYYWINGRSVYIDAGFTTKVAMTDSGIQWFTIDLAKLGISTLPSTLVDSTFSDNGQSCVQFQINAQGSFTTQDVMTRGSDSANLASGATISFRTQINVPWNNMIDSFCDKFYWKRKA